VPEARLLHRTGCEGVEILQQQATELGQPHDDVAAEQRADGLEARVEEPLLRELVRVARRAEVDAHAVAAARLDLVEQRDVLLEAAGHDDRLLASAVDAGLEQHPVARVERDEVELLVGGRAHEPEEVVEHLGHQVPAGAEVEAEAVLLPHACATADLVVLLEHGHLVALAGEQGRAGEARDAAAHDDDPAAVPLDARVAGRALEPGGRHRDAPGGRWSGTEATRPAVACSAIRTLTGSGTRTRARTSEEAGVASRRRFSSANRP
jgi:hypothetical protein